jgi:hypothetical protein
MVTLVRPSLEHYNPSVYFTALWLQMFNKELILERLDKVEEYINESYSRFIDSKHNNVLESELACIERFLIYEKLRKIHYKFTDN